MSPRRITRVGLASSYRSATANQPLLFEKGSKAHGGQRAHLRRPDVRGQQRHEHDKGDHTAAKKHSDEAHGHSAKAHEHSTTAHSKSSAHR